MKNSYYDVIVIGAGPAGINASILLLDEGLDVLVFDTNKSQSNTAWIENYLGFQEGIAGSDLLELGRKQLKDRNCNIIEEKVEEVEIEQESFRVYTDIAEYQADNIILAVGQKNGIEFAKSINLLLETNNEPFAKEKINVDQYFRTSIEGIYACGTCAGISSQAIIAAGNGAQVALNLISDLIGKRVHHHKVMKKVN